MSTEVEPGAAPLANARHEAFCVAYSGHGNATRAYLEAGYSERGAAQSAHTLLRNPDVNARIDNLRRSKFKALHMSADEALAEIAKLARSNMGEVLHITPDGDPYIDLAKASPEFMSSIAEAIIEDFTDGREVDEAGETIKRDVRRVKVKTHNKIAALTLVARAHGLLTDKVEVSLSEDFADTMTAARNRAREARKARNGGGNADEG